MPRPAPPPVPGPGPGHGSAAHSLTGPGFVLVWCTGYLAGALAVAHSAPFTVLVLRFGLTAVVFGALVLAMRVPLPRWQQARHSMVVGVLTLALQFGGVYAAFRLGASPGLSALVIGMMPLTVALLSSLQGERIGPRQWVGLALGLAGVAAVVAERLQQASITPWSCVALAVGLLGISTGTLYQKRHASNLDMRAGLLLQNATGSLVLLPLALALEGFHIDGSLTFAASLAWVVLVNSVGGFALLFVLIRRGAAHQVAALFYLVPPVTALMSAVVLHESLGAAELLGFALAAAGVWLASRG